MPTKGKEAVTPFPSRKMGAVHCTLLNPCHFFMASWKCGDPPGPTLNACLTSEDLGAWCHLPS